MPNVPLLLWRTIFKCIIRKFLINALKGRYFFLYGLSIGTIAKIAKTFSVKELLMYPVCSRLPRINNSNLVRGLLLNSEDLTLTLKFSAVLTALHFEEKTTMLTNAYLIFRCNSSALNSFTLLKK